MTKLILQRNICYVVFILIYPIVWIWFFKIRRYHVEQLNSLRHELKTLIQNTKSPILICANHFTFIDPIILLTLFGTYWDFLRDFRLFAWNLPNIKYTHKNVVYRFFFSIIKCIPIDLTRSAKFNLHKPRWLLSQGENVIIFPEGTRSKTARINRENLTYGAGYLLRELPETKVLCIYIRQQRTEINHSFPKKNEKFTCQIQFLQLNTIYQGMRAERDLANQIMDILLKMENKSLQAKNAQHG